MIVKTDEQLEGLKQIGKIVATIRDEMVNATKPGVTTKALDTLAGELFTKFGALSGPKQTYNFPGNTCICVNEEVAHGIPSDRTIREGDLVNIDVSGSLNGLYADTGISFVVGKGDPQLEHLCKTTIHAFEEGVKKFKAGSKRNSVGKVVQNIARKEGYTVIKNLTGHGIGESLHDEPQHILNYFEPWDNELFKEGMVIAFEPFLSTGADVVFEGEDGWTLLTEDGSLVAQYEHTIVVTKGEPIILTK